MRLGIVYLAFLSCAGVSFAFLDDSEFQDWSESRLTGHVLDADDKGIAGAKVLLNHIRGPFSTRSGNRVTADSDGKYSISVMTKPRIPATIEEVIVSAAGFVQLRERFLAGEVILSPGKETSVRFKLARGEVLSGRVEVPLLGADLLLSLDAAQSGKHVDRRDLISVRGPSYKEYFQTEMDGSFEVHVPKGSYTLLLHRGRPDRFPATLENVASGSTGLKLAPRYPSPSEKELAAGFDALWDDMDRKYSYFGTKKVDWKALKDRFRGEAVAARDLACFVAVLQKLLAPLHDGHVWIEFDGQLPTFLGSRDGNYNRDHIVAALESIAYCKDFAIVGVTKEDGFGAFIMHQQGAADRDAVQQVVDFIRAHRRAPGFLIDLREAAGGDERLALQIARQFCGKNAVYAKSCYRDGPGHDEFGPHFERELTAVREPYLKPVVCLIGPRAVSSGEGFVQMMKCLPHVTTVGARTRGSSGNPEPFQLPGLDVAVWYSRWVDMMPDGSLVEGKGITPDVVVDAPTTAYRHDDPTWDKAIEVLRSKLR